MNFSALKQNSQQILAAALIALLTYFNLKGISFASFIQNLFTFTKIGAIIVLILIGFYVGIQNDWIHFTDFFREVKTYDEPSQQFLSIEPLTLASLFGVAMIGPLFSSSAWNNVTFASQDFEDPKKTIAKGLVYGSALVCFLYLWKVIHLGQQPMSVVLCLQARTDLVQQLYKVFLVPLELP